jgi:arylsulfatase A-like enzyme
MNVIMIMLDNFRADHIGINGNPWIKTPNIDALGGESVRFTKAFPDCLPTIPVRRAIHTGKRTFPCRDWIKPDSWPLCQGWTPIPDDQVTMSEILKQKGYRTAYITDCYHVFKPGMNFHRGFDEWRFIRGQEFDPHRTDSLGCIDVDRFVTPKMDKTRKNVSQLGQYLRNVEFREREEDYFAPQVFSSATRWIEENYQCENFFLYVESFDPHEPWDPPQYYRDMYDPGYQGIEVIHPYYSPDMDYLTEAELKHVRALYAAEITMVDTWLGYFLNKVRQLGLMDNTIVVLMTDHGQNIAENGAWGKCPFNLYPGLMDLIFFVRHPGQSPEVIDSFVYNHEVFQTLFHLLGHEIPEQAEGENLWELVEGKKPAFRDHVTSMFKNWAWVRDDTHAFISRPGGEEAQLYDLNKDPLHKHNIAAQETDIAKRMHGLILEDAGGPFPDHDVQWWY